MVQSAIAAPLACPDVSQFRTDAVRGGVDLKVVSGVWYESLFTDPSQVGASCQVFNNTLLSTTVDFEQHFSVLYGKIPFAQTYVFEATDAVNLPGVYSKYLKGMKDVLQLPTALVGTRFHLFPT